MDVVRLSRLDPPPVNQDEIRRYAGARQSDPALEAVIDGCLKEIGGQLTYAVCWRRFAVAAREDETDLGFAKWRSRDLARYLDGCEEAIAFAATVGMAPDRMIARYQAVSPARALVFQAIGTERIESLCDAFCGKLTAALEAEGRYAKPRFSPGYGDLPLGSQRDLFGLLDCERRLGLTLNGSLLMSPSKSVTALIGISRTPCVRPTAGCAFCDSAACPFRRE
ncbi:MAG: vitamin B12 dependent-methionine synthase activation domain-containing protein [Acutalibacteraceae bacterium]|jgi:hypothetical protein